MSIHLAQNRQPLTHHLHELFTPTPLVLRDGSISLNVTNLTFVLSVGTIQGGATG